MAAADEEDADDPVGGDAEEAVFAEYILEVVTLQVSVLVVALAVLLTLLLVAADADP